MSISSGSKNKKRAKRGFFYALAALAVCYWFSVGAMGKECLATFDLGMALAWGIVGMAMFRVFIFVITVLAFFVGGWSRELAVVPARTNVVAFVALCIGAFVLAYAAFPPWRPHTCSLF